MRTKRTWKPKGYDRLIKKYECRRVFEFTKYFLSMLCLLGIPLFFIIVISMSENLGQSTLCQNFIILGIASCLFISIVIGIIGMKYYRKQLLRDNHQIEIKGDDLYIDGEMVTPMRFHRVEIDKENGEIRFKDRYEYMHYRIKLDRYKSPDELVVTIRRLLKVYQVSVNEGKYIKGDSTTLETILTDLGKTKPHMIKIKKGEKSKKKKSDTAPKQEKKAPPKKVEANTCPECGSKLSEELIECPHCGKGL